MGGFKNLKRSRREADEDESDVEVPKTSKAKKSKVDAAAAPGKDAEGNSYWPLSNLRRVTLSEFKGKQLINIREYYMDANEELRPGKKGISLSIDQYKALLANVPAINEELTAKGHDIPEVSSSAAVASSSQISAKSPRKDTKSAKKAKKSNIEATSDEEDEEEASD